MFEDLQVFQAQRASQVADVAEEVWLPAGRQVSRREQLRVVGRQLEQEPGKERAYIATLTLS